MRSHLTHLTFAMLALLVSGASSAQYRYVAADGTVSYSDTPPPGPASHVTVQNLPSDATLVAAAALPYSLSQAVGHFPVTLYTTTPCPQCDSARAYLKQRGVPFTEKTVNSPADDAVVKRVAGDDSLPVMMVGSQKQIGFAPSGYAGALDDAGYPATSILPRDYSYPAAAPAAGVKPAAATPSDNSSAPSSAPNLQNAPAVLPPPAQGNVPPGFKF